MLCGFLIPGTPARAEDMGQVRDGLRAVENRVTALESRTRGVAQDGGVVFLFAAFCALWAQNTRRNAWLWFFLGLFFSVITIFVLLYKNSRDRLGHEPPSPELRV